MKTVQIISLSFLLLILPSVVFAWNHCPAWAPGLKNFGAYFAGQPKTSYGDCYKGEQDCKNCLPCNPYCYQHRINPPVQYSGIIVHPPLPDLNGEIVAPPPGNYSGIIVNPDRH